MLLVRLEHILQDIVSNLPHGCPDLGVLCEAVGEETANASLAFVIPSGDLGVSSSEEDHGFLQAGVKSPHVQQSARVASVHNHVECLSNGQILVDVLRQLEITIPLTAVVQDAEVLAVVLSRPVPLVRTVAAVEVQKKIFAGCAEEIDQGLPVIFLCGVNLGTGMGAEFGIVNENCGAHLLRVTEFCHFLEIWSDVNVWIDFRGTKQSCTGGHGY